MTRRLIWLKVLLVLWIMTGVLWFGFTLPHWSQLQDTSALENTSPFSDDKGLPYLLKSQFASGSLSLTKEQLSATQQLTDILKDDKKLIVTGYHLSSEKSSIGLARAKYFKSKMGSAGELDDRVILRSEQKDNLLKKKNFLYDVIGVELKANTPSIDHYEDFSIKMETLSQGVLPEEIMLAEYKKAENYLTYNKTGKIYITLSGSKSLEDIETYRTFVDEIKTDIAKNDVPRFKLIGDIQSSDSDSIELSIKYN